MLKDKKVIACDLDGTLAVSKSPISAEMSEVIGKLLPHYVFAIISGGAFPQFEKQVISQIHVEPELFKQLYVFPTMGGMCYNYDTETGSWKKIYDESMPEDERKTILDAFKYAMPASGIDLSHPFGEILEDRGTQVTFSGRGQEAPPDVKKAWDPTRDKRGKIVELLKEKIPNYEFHVNGSSSIDVTRIGLDKGHAIDKIEEILHITSSDIVFFGDAMFPTGNDEPAKKTGVDYVQVDDPEETLELLGEYI